ncbi:hypothetical protein H0H92_004715 [Tricholoma furcatifolium]|nr:hypothetical protein H0H92_004715 [Tricholoma furcatifolium]
MRWSLCAALLLTVPFSSALHESDVGVVDWHKLLVGVPQVAAPVTAPSWNADIIYTATTNNVLAALDPRDGSFGDIFMKQTIVSQDTTRILTVSPDLTLLLRAASKYSTAIATLSGPGGAVIRLFNGTTGTLHLEKRLHASETGRNADPPHLGTHVAFGNDNTVFVLTNGNVVKAIDGSTGEERWTWTSENHLNIHTNLVSTSTALYVIAFARTPSKMILHITVLDPRTGESSRAEHIPSDIKQLHSFIVLSDSKATSEAEHPHIIWIENGEFKTIKLTPDLETGFGEIIYEEPQAASKVSYERFIDVGLTSSGNVVAVTGDGSATLVGLVNDRVQGLGKFDTLVNPNPKRGEDGTDFTWVGNKVEGEVTIARLYWSHEVNKVKCDSLVYSPVVGAPPSLKSDISEVAFDTNTHGAIIHGALSRSRSGLPSLLLTTSTGAVQLWDLSANATEIWSREESLASIALAEFVQLPEGREAGGAASRKDKEGFAKRLWRHAGDAKNLPHYISNFVRRFLTGSYASTTSIPASSEEALVRDAFGFRQIIVVATTKGKLFGLDSSTGRIIWNRVLGLGWAAEVGANVLPVKMFVLETEEDKAEVVLVTQRRADNSLVDTVVFHIDALTGSIAPDAITSHAANSQEDPSLLQGFDIIPGPLIDTFLLSPSSGDSTKKHRSSVLLLDEFLQVYLYPSTPETRATLRDLQPSLHFPLRTNANGVARVMGHSIGPHYEGPRGADSDDGERGFVAHPTWTLGLPPGETVTTMIPPLRGPVASLGKVLGDRTTLYKYLNPRLFVVLTAPAPKTVHGKTCGLYLVDAVKGTVVYRVSLPALNGVGKEACDVKATLSENWLVYHYYDPDWEGAGLSKGWKMISVELYEGNGVDQKTQSSDMSSYDKDSINVLAYEQAYLFPHAITALSPTSTKFGMTVKDVIVATRSHQVASIRRHVLNPRRPHRKVTAQEQEEFLVPYDPVLLPEPQRILSHNYEVANIQRIVTSPALLESTSLVFTYGLDMFATRTAPSNTFDVLSENFNKAQLVLTVSGLALAIIFTKPMVQRKRLREKWYQ